MKRKANVVRQLISRPADLDDMDRKLLGLLAEDATRSYAELSKLLHLSAPAVHERVKRLKRDGVIRRTVAALDGPKIGRPLLAFVHIDTEGWGKSAQLLALSAEPEVEEIHSVAGDACMLFKVRTRDAQALEDLLAKIYNCPGVKGTRSYITLSTYMERGVQCAIAP